MLFIYNKNIELFINKELLVLLNILVQVCHEEHQPFSCMFIEIVKTSTSNMCAFNVKPRYDNRTGFACQRFI